MPIRANLRESHHVNFHEVYPSWGLAGKENRDEAKESKELQTKAASTEEIKCAEEIVTNLGLYQDSLILSTALIVPCYQGPDKPIINATLLRYTKSGSIDIGKEHKSFLVNLSEGQLIGLTDMIKHSDGALIHPSEALNKAVHFLSYASPDLIEGNQLPAVSFPEDLDAGQGVNITTENDGDFTSGASLGNVSLHWIDKHYEKIINESGNEEIVAGMKVKMRFNDSSERYAWVIIDNNNVQVFERNIFWNFSDFKRETQMWLHDGWIQAHGIDIENKKNFTEDNTILFYTVKNASKERATSCEYKL